MGNIIRKGYSTTYTTEFRSELKKSTTRIVHPATSQKVKFRDLLALQRETLLFYTIIDVA